VTANHTCKVCDFGLSRVKGETFHSNRLYKRIIPPELENTDHSNYTAPADVYMYGLLIYELLTKNKANGVTPHIIDDMKTKVVVSLSSSSLPILIILQPQVFFMVDIIKKCTAPLPELRPTFECIITELERHTHPVVQQMYVDVSPLKPIIQEYTYFNINCFTFFQLCFSREVRALLWKDNERYPQG